MRSESSWSLEDVGRLDDVEISFNGARRITAIDPDSSGSPHIATYAHSAAEPAAAEILYLTTG